jgi:hypothetical protein
MVDNVKFCEWLFPALYKFFKFMNVNKTFNANNKSVYLVVETDVISGKENSSKTCSWSSTT